MELNVELSDDDEVVHDASRAIEDPSDTGAVLVAIEALRCEMDARFKEMKREVSEITKAQARLHEISGDVRAGLQSLTTEMGTCAPQDIKGKRGRSPKLQHLDYAAGAERAVDPLLTWAIIATVVSFVRSMPSLRFWVSNSMMTKMAPYAEVLDNSEGFAMIFFSVKNNAKSKLATPAGRMWTFLLRRALRTVIINAKANLFRKESDDAGTPAPLTRRDPEGMHTSAISVSEAPEPEAHPSSVLPLEPEWMTRFKDNHQIVRAVDDAMRKFEGFAKDVSFSSASADSVSQGPTVRPKKRKKTNSDDGEHEFRMFVVKQIRTMWLEKMNHGRTAVRTYLYKRLVFILDKIVQFKSIDRARHNGYRIVLGLEVSPCETITKDTPGLQSGPWNIPDALVNGSSASIAKNAKLLQNLKEQFPSLAATISYKKMVRIDATEVDTAMDGARLNSAEYVPVTEFVSLHDVANEMLMELFCCEDRASVLGVSELSLKAIHVLAIALRGLVISVLDACRETPVPLSSMELAAFGNDVTLYDESKIAIMMEKTLKNGKLTDTYLSHYKEKFTATEEEAAILRRANLRNVQSEPGLHANIERHSDRGLLEEDLGEDWIRKK